MIFNHHSNDAVFIHNFLSSIAHNSWEAKIDFVYVSSYRTLGKVFLDVLKELSFKDCCNHSLIFLAQKFFVKTPRVGSTSEFQKKQLQLAINFSKKIGFNVDKYEIIVTNDLEDKILGLGFEGKIYIAERVFLNNGVKELASILIEEFIHLEYELHDETRSMQNFLFGVIATMGETLIQLKELNRENNTFIPTT